MMHTILDYGLAIFFSLICVVFTMSMFVSLPERNDNEFSE